MGGLRFCPGRFEAVELGLNQVGLADGGGDRLSRLETVAGDVSHGGFVRIDLALLHQLLQHGDGGTACGFGENALGFSQQLDALDDLGVADGGDAAVGLLGDVDGVGAVCRVADGNRLGDGVGLHRRDEVPAFRESLGDRGAALGLGAAEAHVLLLY